MFRTGVPSITAPNCAPKIMVAKYGAAGGLCAWHGRKRSFSVSLLLLCHIFVLSLSWQTLRFSSEQSDVRKGGDHVPHLRPRAANCASNLPFVSIASALAPCSDGSAGFHPYTQNKTPLCSTFSLCLSRACLGKMIIFSTTVIKWLKKGAWFLFAPRSGSRCASRTLLCRGTTALPRQTASSHPSRRISRGILCSRHTQKHSKTRQRC